MNPHRSIARFAATALVTVAYVALSAASVGCGGGNNSTSSATTTVSAVFTPDTPTAANGSITLLPGTASGASVDVRVTVTQMANFFGAAFRIKYDATALLFQGPMDTSTSVLNGVPDNELLFRAESQISPGEIVITATRVFPAPPVPLVSATSDLVILNFVARRTIPAGDAIGRLDFADPKNACNGSVFPCGPIAVTAWKGGGVSAVQ